MVTVAPGLCRDDTQLLMACDSGDAARVTHLLEVLGADANACDQFMDTPLLLAAASGHAAVCRALLRAGAAVDARGRVCCVACVHARLW